MDVLPPFWRINTAELFYFIICDVVAVKPHKKDTSLLFEIQFKIQISLIFADLC